MSEMVERVAKSMFAFVQARAKRLKINLRDDMCSWDELGNYQEEYREEARAAIQAMREPDDATLDAMSRASNTYPAVPEGYAKEPVHRFVATQMWRAAIDEALK